MQAHWKCDVETAEQEQSKKNFMEHKFGYFGQNWQFTGQKNKWPSYTELDY